MIKRAFDIMVSSIGLAIISPLFLFIALAIKLDSPGPVYFRQARVGLYGRTFKILKFRTMAVNADKYGPITMLSDTRITSVGFWLRRFKLDEFPTLFNVLNGDMSIVGPRPELPLYVEQYTRQQKRALSVRPGITDPGTLRFDDEARMLNESDNYERAYLEQILPEKLRLNLEYIDNRSFLYDLRIIFVTLWLTVRRKGG